MSDDNPDPAPPWVQLWDGLRERGFCPVETWPPQEDWFDLACYRVTANPDHEVGFFAFTGSDTEHALRWEARFGGGVPAAAVLAAIDALIANDDQPAAAPRG